MISILKGISGVFGKDPWTKHFNNIFIHKIHKYT